MKNIKNIQQNSTPPLNRIDGWLDTSSEEPVLRFWNDKKGEWSDVFNEDHSVIEGTYQEIRQLAESGKLLIDKKYIVNDYEDNLTIDYTTQLYENCGRTFAILLTPNTTSSFSEDAFMKCIKGGFDSINYWMKCKYKLINTEFDWVAADDDPDGRIQKGAIYYLEDIYDNCAPYNYLNIRIKLDYEEYDGPPNWAYNLIGYIHKGEYLYTFTCRSMHISEYRDYSTDSAMDYTIYNCRIAELDYGESDKKSLKFNAFIANTDTPVYSIFIGRNSYCNIIGGQCINITLGDNCRDNLIFGNFYKISIGNYSSVILGGVDMYFSDQHSYIKIGEYNYVYLSYGSQVTIGNYNVVFLNTCDLKNASIGDNNEIHSVNARYVSNINIGNKNTIYFGDSCTYINIGNNSTARLGLEYHYIYIGNNSYFQVTNSKYPGPGTSRPFVRNIKVDDYCRVIIFPTETLSPTTPVEKLHFHSDYDKTANLKMKCVNHSPYIIL